MKQDKRAVRILCLLGIVPVVWLGLLIAPAASGGLPEIFARFTEAMNDPTHIELCEDSFKTVLLFLFAYEPMAGDIIFLDWESDGLADHVGIVERVEGGVIYTVEGNADDRCIENHYFLDSAPVYGFGLPTY